MITAFVLIKVGTGEHLNFAKSAKEEMMKIEGVTKVYGVFGRFDIIAKRLKRLVWKSCQESSPTK